MIVFLTVRQRVEAIQEVRKGGSPRFCRGGNTAELLEKTTFFCQRNGLLFGEYVAYQGRDPVPYFRKYGTTAMGFRRYWDICADFRARLGVDDALEAMKRWCEQSGVEQGACPDYIHLLEILKGAYNVSWSGAGEEIYLRHYPLLPDGNIPSVYDLVSHWVLFNPSRFIEEGIPLSSALAGTLEGVVSLRQVSS